MFLTFFQQNSEVPEANNNRPPFWRMVFVLRVSLPLIVAITSNELILPQPDAVRFLRGEFAILLSPGRNQSLSFYRFPDIISVW